MTRKGMGMTAVVHADGSLAGIFTDGDLRRAMERLGDVRSHTVAASMTTTPLTIQADVMAVDAARLMDEQSKNQLLVLDGVHLVGALHMHDLMKAKVI
jgi:arabinose-5-phosphate isomerase